ncbi:MAG: sensor histidine kinase, partial [Geminicoccaceae bacterium]
QREISKDLQIVYDPGDLPIDIHADGKLLRQVFSNLISNAVKYSPGSSKIWINGYRSNGMIVISFHDQGVGIPEKELESLFGRFFRATTATGIPGTGIGLHLVKNLVDMHAGTIEVESATGEGSTFTISLPVDKPSEEPMPICEALVETASA